MGVQHYENFPVASVLCPPRLRAPIVAIYRFARTADDLADEGEAPVEQRLADLAQYRNDFEAVRRGASPGPRWTGVFEPLAQQMREFTLPAEHLHALLDAFVQDVHNPAYAGRDQLLTYCARSANPVGRLLLHLYGITDELSLRRSDAICSALQLINFWQDLSVDGPRGRHYVPTEASQRHGVMPDELRRAQDSPRARALVAELCGWAEALMLEGAPLALTLPGRAGWELRLVVQGGLRILERIRRMDHAALTARPKLGPRDLPLLLWRAWRMHAQQAAPAWRAPAR